MNENYIDLCIRAHLFADFMGYDLAYIDGCFDFYNSPIARSFDFNVNPDTYKGESADTILKAFYGRKVTT